MNVSPLTPARAWLGFTAMAVGMFLAILDIQIVASSLIEIQADLRIPAIHLSYLQTTYLIAEVIAIAMTGALTRGLSTHALFAIGMIGFVVASAACAVAPTYPILFGFRFLQGLFGGVLIPSVFSAALLLFPRERQTLATIIGGGLATLAPTVGPFIGGWITEHLSWHWLFLINIAPGLVVAALVVTIVRIDRPQLAFLRRLDWISASLAAVALAALELTLKEGPQQGWLSGETMILAAICVGCGLMTLQRCRHCAEPLIDVGVFRDRNFALGAFYSFVLGMALFGATYLLPLFLGLVRTLGPLEIGTVMMVTGAAQLITAPLAAKLERHMAPRLLTAIGYGLFAAGLLWNGAATPAWDFKELAGPQVLRGAALLLCLLPTTRLALGQLSPDRMAQGSSLFNLMRNVGGAVGLAVIDTIIETRPAHHITAIAARLQAGDRATAAFVGLPLERFHGQPMGEVDASTREMIAPLVKAAAATASFNDAWLVLGALSALALFMLPFMRPVAADSSPPPANAPTAPRH